MDARPVRFDLAKPADDAAIRRILAAEAVPGSVTLTYERNPDFFRGCAVTGRCCQVLVGRTPDGAIAGFAVRATRPLFVNGQVEEVGYLSQLRVAAPFRGRWLVPPGFRALRALHDASPVRGYLATITEGNDVAEGLLVSRARRHFPAFRPVARVLTLALIVRRRRLVAPPRDLTIAPAGPEDRAEVVAFLRREGAGHQFSPAWCEADFSPGDGATLGFALADLLVARRGGAIVGTLGLWDQTAYKQTIVRAYAAPLGRLRPLYNAGARLAGLSPLPRPGQALRYAHAAFACAAGDDRAVFGALLRAVHDRAASRAYAYLMLGLAEGDPLLPVARAYPRITYPSTLYTACWENGGDFHDQLDGRIPRVEIATL